MPVLPENIDKEELDAAVCDTQSSWSPLVNISSVQEVIL